MVMDVGQLAEFGEEQPAFQLQIPRQRSGLDGGFFDTQGGFTGGGIG